MPEWALVMCCMTEPEAVCIYRQQRINDTVQIPCLNVKIMELTAIPFGITDWSTVEPIAHPGEAGTAYWRTCHFGGIRVRMVEYTPGYLADHWCHKGHVLLCMGGQLDTELDDGRTFTLRAGMSYQVADNAEAHRSSTLVGAKLFIVD